MEGHISVDYPVGSNMHGVTKYVMQAADIFKNTFSSRTVNVFCRGSSGAILAGLFSSYLIDTFDIKIVHIKKEGEHSHSEKVPSHFDNHGINVIIDDFISSGSTVRNIYKAICDNVGFNLPIHALIIERGWRDGLGFEPDYLIYRY